MECSFWRGKLLNSVGVHHHSPEKNIASGCRTEEKKRPFSDNTGLVFVGISRLRLFHKISWHAEESSVKFARKCTYVCLSYKEKLNHIQVLKSDTFLAFQVFASRLRPPVWQEQKYYFNSLGLWAAWFMLHYFSRLSEFGQRWRTRTPGMKRAALYPTLKSRDINGPDGISQTSKLSKQIFALGIINAETGQGSHDPTLLPSHQLGSVRDRCAIWKISV